MACSEGFPDFHSKKTHTREGSPSHSECSSEQGRHGSAAPDMKDFEILQAGVPVGGQSAADFDTASVLVTIQGSEDATWPAHGSGIFSSDI